MCVCVSKKLTVKLGSVRYVGYISTYFKTLWMMIDDAVIKSLIYPWLRAEGWLDQRRGQSSYQSPQDDGKLLVRDREVPPWPHRELGEKSLEHNKEKAIIP